MKSLLQLSRASWGILVLALCLQLVINNAQEDEATNINLTMEFLDTANETEETLLMLTLSTELEECMVVSAYLKSSLPMDTSFNLTQTACLCNDSPRHLYWQLAANQTMTIEAHADAVPELGICPDDEAVIPIVGSHASVEKTVTPTED